MANNEDTTVWGTDTPISMPVPPQDSILVDMGAFGFTQFGIAHNITRGDVENYVPTFLPVAHDG